MMARHARWATLALVTLAAAPGSAGGLALAGHHNGSTVDILDGRIVYATPKPALRDVVRPGATLVEGRWRGNRFTGIAYAFKTGCPAARYAVTGQRAEDGTMVFSGPGPVRQGCAVTRYDPASPHSRLVVDRIWSP